MFTIAIPNNDPKGEPIILKTERRNLARAAKELGNENKIVVEVTEEVKPRVVKFKGVD